jgi:hypothetical protein
VPLSWTPFFNDGSFRSQTMLDGMDSFSFYDQQDKKVSGTDHLSDGFTALYADGPQATRRGGLYTCSGVCGAIAPGAGAGYLAGVDVGALHGAADAWHLDHHIGDTSTGASAYAGAAVGDMLHLDHAATVHFKGYVEGEVDASGEHSQADERFGVLVFDPASVQMEGDSGLLANLRGGYSYQLREQGSGPGTIVNPPPGPAPRHFYDLTVDLPAGDSFVSIMLETSARGWQSGAQSYFGDTATFSLLAPPDANARFASGLVPLVISPVPEPGSAALAGCGLLMLLAWRRTKGR